MKKVTTTLMVALLASIGAMALAADKEAKKTDEGWISLFDGKSFGKWRINENPDSWRIEGGAIVANGPRSHLFYTGGEYKNFEFKADVMTKKGSNSGIYFHTKFQAEGWPAQGYESQVNVTHRDPVKTGSIYNTVKLSKTPAQDNKWWTQHIIVKDKHVIVKIDGETVIDYTEPDDKKGPVKLSKGTFALQAHDPGSEVRYRNIFVKPLP